ncbi:MAG: ABC transporter substrate-binding protein [Devosia sp.]
MTNGMSRRGFLALSSGMALASTLGMIRAANGQETIEEITWALSSVPETLFVPHAWSVDNGVIMSLVQEGPLLFGDDLAMIPGPAESWELTDPTTVVYHLRSGVTFSDGSPLTADDVVATINYHLNTDSGSQVASFYSSVDAVEATDPATVTIKLKAPNVQFQYWAAHMAGFLFKADQLGNEDLGSPDLLPLGTGPYRLVSFAPAERVVLEARDDYWGGAPVIKKITIVAIPDEQTRILAMQNGDIDGTFHVAITNLEQWQALPDAAVYTAPSLGTFVLPIDHSTAPFDDLHVRRAVAYSVDREGLVKALLKGNGEPLAALNPVEMWTGVLTPEEVRAFYATIPDYKFDMEKAKAELAQSAHASGFAFTTPVSSALPDMVNSLQSLAQNLKTLNIDMTVQEMDANQWLAQYFRHENLGMQSMNYYPDFADPAGYPYLFFHSDNARVDGMNASNFKNPDVDAAIDTANENADPAARAEALKRAFEIANDQVALIPLFTPHNAMALSSKYQMTGYNAFWYNIPWAMRGFGPRA